MGALSWFGVTLGVALLGVVACHVPAEIDTFSENKSVPLNIIWIVTSESHAPVDLIAGTQYLNTRMSPGSQAESQSTLLTGVPAVDLALGDNGLYGIPPIGLKLVSEYLRRAGYYTSRSGFARHNLFIPNLDKQAVDAAEREQPGLLGAWDSAGVDAHWRGKDDDWDSPCTVAFGCGVSATDSSRPFYSLFNLEQNEQALRDGEVERILVDLETDGLIKRTVVFHIGLYDASFDLVVRWPRGSGQAVSRDPVRLIDLAPTTLALAGIDQPRTMPGRVFLDLTGIPIVVGNGDQGASVPTTRGSTQWHDQVVPQAADPRGYPTGGLFHSAPQVELWCDTEGSTIIYTTERVSPFYWRLYTGPFRMRFWTLRTKCGRLGYLDSDVTTYEFDIE